MTFLKEEAARDDKIVYDIYKENKDKYGDTVALAEILATNLAKSAQPVITNVDSLNKELNSSIDSLIKTIDFLKESSLYIPTEFDISINGVPHNIAEAVFSLQEVQETLAAIRYYLDDSYKTEVADWQLAVASLPESLPTNGISPEVVDEALTKEWYTDTPTVPPTVSPQFTEKYNNDTKFKELVDKYGYLKGK